MKLLDLFCCCGGISKGFAENGFECVGVDITDNHNYPYDFIHKNVFDLSSDFFKQFDIIHASPPCQHYTFATRKESRKNHPDLVARTRLLLEKTGKPYIIENVPNAPIRNDLMLCGEMFGLRVIRHRKFEIKINGFKIIEPVHNRHKPKIDGKHSYYSQIAGHGGDSYSYKIDDWKKDIGINWVNDKTHLTQMIPPAYSNYISSKISNFKNIIQGQYYP